ncbi:MAG: ATP-binding protein [Puniceicoccales bacterium]|jgi:thymidylate kinase|nr:ATP-binding protein [Puniceicoccales bacterium]
MKAPYKCLITGTHGCGKSTLAHRICSELKRQGHNAIVISETARECPFPINKGQTLDSTLFIALRQAVKELEAVAHGYTHLVLDRGVLDSFVYSAATRPGPISELEKAIQGALATWSQQGYNQVIFLRCDSRDAPQALQADGVRETDLAFARKIDELFENFITPAAFRNFSSLSYSQALGCRISVEANGQIFLHHEH